MNLANVEKRIQALKARVDKLKPKPPREPLVFTVVSRIHPLAPEGTKSYAPGHEHLRLKGPEEVFPGVWFVPEEEDDSLCERKTI